MTEEYKREIFFAIHSDNLHEAPGDFENTRRAFNLLRALPERPLILDIGCGAGRQSLDLQRLSKGTVIAFDLHLPFVRALHKLVCEKQISRLRILQADMNRLPFAHGWFDLIWSEGAIYSIGFAHGLANWKPLLKPGGYLVVSDLSWLTSDVPAELHEFWQSEYPAMQTVPNNLALFRQTGYRLLDHFVLTRAAGWAYYQPLTEKINFLRERYHKDAEALAVLEHEWQEIELFRKYADYYGYVFYIGQKP